MVTSQTKRPRNVNTLQAASILYGDWGTSKAYVIGLAFAIAAYASFWIIFAVCILMALVAINYITICKYSPSGGGVYASVRKRSEVLSLVGAFFLIADYLVTASLSALSSFNYLGVAHPEIWAMGSIIFIGMINFFGPRHTGNLAFLLTLPTVIVLIILGVLALPHLPEAWHSVERPHDSLVVNWTHFVSIIVALSGIEAIANTTGVMQLDPGSTEENPSVHRTSKRAILLVMTEVCIFTAIFGLAMHALPGLVVENGDVFSSNGESIRDAMLRHMGNVFASHQWGEKAGHIFGTIIGLVFTLLLLSAVNTAIIALTSLLFIMSRDGELPARFQKITSFGVPIYPLLASTFVPVIILIFVNDMVSLANLYAVGFVGAIATNLGSTSLDQTVPMTKKERYFMFATFIIMALVEITLFIDKPEARRFVLSILTVGLILRAFVWEQRQKQWAARKVKLKHASLFTDDTRTPLHEGAIMCAVRTVGKTLEFALEEAKRSKQPLYILFIREQKVITEEDRARLWIDDDEACRIFDYAKDSAHEVTIKFFYTVSDSPVDTIVEMAKELKVSRLVLGRSRHPALLQMIRGNIVQEISDFLPIDIDLLVIS